MPQPCNVHVRAALPPPSVLQAMQLASTASLLLVMCACARAYELCGAGNVFKRVACKYYDNAADIAVVEKTSSFVLCNQSATAPHVISCGDQQYSLSVETIAGTTEGDVGGPIYYARGTATPLDGDGSTYEYCWKRKGSHTDSCACLCEAIRQGQGQEELGPFRTRPECKCI